MEFLSTETIDLINGGYLVVKKSKKPVFHKEFVDLQNKAHYFVTLAKNIEGKKFECDKVDSFNDIVNQTLEELNSETKVTYIAKPKSADTTLLDQLTAEAKAFLNQGVEESTVEAQNEVLQQFNLLHEFEQFGLYFKEGDPVKLSKIYTIAEIVEAYKLVAPQLSK